MKFNISLRIEKKKYIIGEISFSFNKNFYNFQHLVLHALVKICHSKAIHLWFDFCLGMRMTLPIPSKGLL